ncbi:ABC transporter ATP-binding protein [Streptomyces litchfieldiae]|uniref:ABC transporter ATP-binding protein n=1 Tax=Streptomyces litchfieldiae TaxID=3075543 RepID=A0ABU2N462_9ACTN|nr:ABC transporter ATP-binding protein [Streptomyces sp. DSM 44938]MDT0347514.1 ABC transporter ATP-binding protein [Streptomyces sp. DSM 44938]
MIRHLLALWPDRAALYRVLALFAALGLTEGLLFALLVPVLHELLAPEPRLADLTPWALGGVVLIAAHWTLTVLATPVSFAASFSLTRALQLRIGHHLTTLPLGWFTPDHKARVAREISHSAAKAGGFVGQLAPRIVTALTTPLTLLVTTLILDWRIGVLLLAVAPLAWGVMRWYGRVARRTDHVLDTTEAELTGRTIELAQAQPVLRAAGHARDGGVRMRQALDQQHHAYHAALRASIAPRLAYVAVLLAPLAAATATATWLMRHGEITIAEGTTLLLLVVLFIEPLSVLNDAYGGVQSTRIALTRVTDILTAPPLPAPRRPGVHPAGHDIHLDNVTFAYHDGAPPALRDVSFHCPAGTTAALLGPSGSGKTTVTRLIARFHDVTTGAIRIGGADIRNLPTDELTDHLAIVFQDVYLLDDTIENNVRLARPDATPDEVHAAAAAARLDEVIYRLPDGWHTQVGEGGARLSGGERQRVSLARALLKNAPIVLLDEAAASLDPENERLVTHALHALAADRSSTIVVIAHRIETLAKADHFVVLDHGRVAESGTLPELLAADGRLAALWTRHAEATEGADG